MKRRLFLATAIGAGLALAANRNIGAATDSSKAKEGLMKLDKTKSEWKKLLKTQEYDVLFNEATERPWSSHLNEEKRQGTYICAACNQPLFQSKTKFDSGTGWPSFYQSIEGSTGVKKDWKLIFPRTEYHCGRCGGHQGHIFNDGPEPTGKRWCNNGVALKFVSASESLPTLRV
ncbi:MAG: peptide-methionine (R)-S-oxide reductase [Gammaproteobacteria bacterium]|jgi:peptide-methionine (R)-S-oxide reductase